MADRRMWKELMAAQNPSRRPRLSARDWIEAALGALERDGVHSVAVEPLAEKLGVTKGSFYSHFRDRDELLRAVLGAWRDDEAARIEQLAEKRPSAGDVLDAVLGDMFDNDSAGRLFAHVCAAGADTTVAPYAFEHALTKVQILTDLLHNMGTPHQEASQTAELTYTAYIGYWRIKSMFPPGDANVLPGYLDHLRSTLLPQSRG